ncbi:hypothetical protein ZIOFF_019603 [Zingiber officinale]|uniref:Uncharacterized protein n=1 Tax=Zingiber officinale TaxID=94328 RepID=A0A8J5LP26_ZINOF|nr:hypothetical protein ZIOFF_019603 [Zingiber officinale]
MNFGAFDAQEALSKFTIEDDSFDVQDDLNGFEDDLEEEFDPEEYLDEEDLDEEEIETKEAVKELPLKSMDEKATPLVEEELLPAPLVPIEEKTIAVEDDGAQNVKAIEEVVIPIVLVHRVNPSSENNVALVYRYLSMFQKLSKFLVIDYNKDKEVRCFSKVIVYLRLHKELNIDPTHAPNNYSMVDFTKFLREGFSLERDATSNIGDLIRKIPRILIIGVLERVPIIVWNEALVVILCSMYELAYVNYEMSRKLSAIGLLKLTRRWSSSLYKKCIRDTKMDKNNVHDVRSMEEVPSAHKCGSVLRSNAQPWSDAGPSDLFARLERDSVMSRHVHGGAALICFLYILQRIYSRGSSSELPRYHANTGSFNSLYSIGCPDNDKSERLGIMHYSI